MLQDTLLPAEWDILQMLSIDHTQEGVSHGAPGPLGNTTTFIFKNRNSNVKADAGLTHTVSGQRCIYVTTFMAIGLTNETFLL